MRFLAIDDEPELQAMVDYTFGVLETLGIEKCQPGFLCFEPTRCCLLIGESVRFIAGCLGLGSSRYEHWS